MNQSKTGNRIVAIAGTAPSSGPADSRQAIEQRPTARRIVVISNGKPVGRRRGR
jgi:hypothetical protein